MLSYYTLTGEQVMVVLPQFQSTLIQFPGTLSGLRTETSSHVLDTLFAIWVQENHNGVPLGIVQTVHSIGSDVQHSMLILKEEKSTSERFGRRMFKC